MKALYHYMRRSYLCKALLLCLAYVFPVMALHYLTSSEAPDAMNYMWVGFYSCILVCIVMRNIVVKAGALALNLGCFLMLMCVFTLGGMDMVPGMLLKMVFPFVPNPWLEG